MVLLQGIQTKECGKQVITSRNNSFCCFWENIPRSRATKRSDEWPSCSRRNVSALCACGMICLWHLYIQCQCQQWQEARWLTHWSLVQYKIPRYSVAPTKVATSALDYRELVQSWWWGIRSPHSAYAYLNGEWLSKLPVALKPKIYREARLFFGVGGIPSGAVRDNPVQT